MNITAFNPATAHQAPARFNKAELWANTSAKPPQINSENGRFTAYVEGSQVGQPQHELDIVILDEFPKGRAVSRTYFGRADNPNIPAIFDPKNTSIPACHSIDGVAPAGDSKFPQSDKCMTCAQNIAGSGGTSTGRACRFSKSLAVNVPAFGQEIFVMRVSSQAIFAKSDNAKNEHGLFALNAALGNYAMQEVITKIHFPDGATGGIRFSPVGVLDDAGATIMVEMAKSPRVAEVLRSDREITTPALPAPAALQRVALPQPVAYAAPQAPAPVYQAPQAPAPVYAAPVQQPVYAAPIPHVAPAPAVAVADVAQPVQAPVAAAAPVAAQPGFQSRLSAAFAPRK